MRPTAPLTANGSRKASDKYKAILRKEEESMFFIAVGISAGLSVLMAGTYLTMMIID